MVSDVVFFKKFETAFFRERLLLGHDTKTLAIVHVQNLTPTFTVSTTYVCEKSVWL